MTFRVALCDDEPIFKKQVETNLERYTIRNDIDATFAFEFYYYQTAKELLETTQQYDILFLDIMLKDNVDGIKLGAELRRRGNDAVFLLFTSMDRFRDGYKIGVLRYLKKPIDPMDFFEAMDAALKEFQVPRKRFFIKMKSGDVCVALNEVMYIERYYRSKTIYTTKESYKTSEDWDSLRERLPVHQFYSPQKSYIINLEHVASVNSQHVIMSNGRKINFSRTSHGSYTEFNKIFHRYLGD